MTIYVSRSSFATVLDGVPVVVRRGATVRQGHPLLTQHAGLFDVYKPDFEYVRPTPPPAPPAPPPAPKKAAPTPPPKRQAAGE
ncbi:hypothetical protein [Streptomyces sp. S1]|uniref:hypothetical protein n=1 Tax=Streptomyces sp. S1 TaxID=718288 RepID=UPI003D7547BB